MLVGLEDGKLIIVAVGKPAEVKNSLRNYIAQSLEGSPLMASPLLAPLRARSPTRLLHQRDPTGVQPHLHLPQTLASSSAVHPL